METSLTDPREVNLLFDRSRLSRHLKDEIPEGKSTNLLFVTLRNFRAPNSVIQLGKFFSLLKDRSSSCSFLREAISGGRNL
jgi:hypothetical protein